MIVHDVVQGTPAWDLLRLGLPSASQFEKVYTSTGKIPKAFEEYVLELAAERITKQKTQVFTNEWMQRGKDLEPVAVSAYELITDTESQVIGFVTNDDRTVGCSPDRWQLEVKCPAAKNHLKYLSGGKCPAKYYPQVQGCIYLCETDRWDFMSYHPGMKPLITTVYRDEIYIKGLEGALALLLERVSETEQANRGENNV